MPVPIVVNIARLAAQIAKIIFDLKESDDKKREEFIRQFLDESAKQYPDYNASIIHTKHETTGENIHAHFEVDIKLGGTIGYDAFYSKKGQPFSLTNKGDGGWINWGYVGEFERNDMTIKATEHG